MESKALLLAVAVLLIAASTGCEQPVTSESDGDAPIAIRGELHVSKDAQAAIGLAVRRVQQQSLRDSMTTTGWLAVRPIGEVVVTAPLTGFVTPRDQENTTLGQSVSMNQRLGDLHVLLSPQEQAQLVAIKEEADIVIQQAQASLTLAEKQLQRLESNASAAVPGTRLMELREVVARSRAAEQETREKLPFLPAEPYAENMQLKAVPLDAPLSGRLVNVHFAPRQLVAQGDPLWTIADWSRLWIRVPVYAADLIRVVQDEPVTVVLPGEKNSRTAKPINIPQPTEPGKQTVELVYEIENAAGDLRPGQAVFVSLPSGESSNEVVIPRSGVIWDGMGNSWVFVKTSATTFHRRKIELGQLLKDSQVVRRGLEENDEVVTIGAEALYGEEFNWQLQAEDDD